MGGLLTDSPYNQIAWLVVLGIGACTYGYFIAFAGEIGLSGEIRPVTRIEQRVAEAAKLGFKKIYISKFNKKGIDFSKFNIEVFGASKVEQVFRDLFA